MTKLSLVLIALIMAPVAFGATVAPPCESGSYDLIENIYPHDPLAPLQPVPSNGSFTCRGITFDSFSDNILDGGLIGAAFVTFPYGTPPPFGGTCCGSWPGDLIRFTVQPVNPTLGFSFRVRGDFGDAPLRGIGLPPLNQVTSGNPTVTANIDGIDLTTSAAEGSGYVRHPAYPDYDNSWLVVVEPGDITGGTISAFSIVVATPEPSTWGLFALGIVWIACRSRRHRCP